MSVYESKIPRRIFWSKKGGEHYIISCRHSLFISSDIVKMIKPRRMSCVNHVSCMKEVRSLCRILVAKPEERDHLYDLDTCRVI
jgi:hypothetical protein